MCSTKFMSTGFTSRDDREKNRDEDFTLNRVSELSFIGSQIHFGAEGKVIFHQRRWIVRQLQEGNWVHLRGQQSLPQAESVGTENKEDPGFAKRRRCQHQSAQQRRDSPVARSQARDAFCAECGLDCRARAGFGARLRLAGRGRRD